MADQELNQRNPGSASTLKFDGWALKLQSGELERGEKRVRLQEHPFKVLQALIERPGELVTREALIARLWPEGVVDFETGLNTAMRKLRVALGDTADTPRYIETLPRRGYRFIGRIEAPIDISQAGAVARDPGSAPLPPPVVVGEPSPIHALHRPNTWYWWFTMGVSIVVIGVLTIGITFLNRHPRGPGAQNPPTNSVSALPGGTRNEAAMAAYLDGVRMAEATVADATQGRAILGKLDEAIRLDPQFALAYAARSRALIDYGGHFMVDAMPDAFTQAKADAERAIALAPMLGEAQAALGDVYSGAFADFPRAEQAYARAVELAPNDVRVLRAYSTFEGFMGSFDKATAMARRSVALEPTNIYSHLALGEILLFGRRYVEAAAEFTETIRLEPGHASEAYQRRGRALYLAQQYEPAAATCEAEPDRYTGQLCLAMVYDKLGRSTESESILQTAIAEQGDYAAYEFAEIYAQRGVMEKAMEWLETAVRTNDPGMIYLKTDPFLDPLRDQERFQAILRALRFPN